MSKLISIFEPKCVHRHTAKTHPNCFRNGKPIQPTEVKPSKVLVFDIETLPLWIRTWGRWPEYPSNKQLIHDYCILSWSAKWLNDDKIISECLTPKETSKRDDERIVRLLWKLLDSADVVIAHNGKRFDIRKVNTRFWKYNLPKPSSYKVIDTLVSVKEVFGLSFNNQDYIAKFKELEEKLDTNYELWIACENGDKNALDYMRTYNEGDVRTLEQIYLDVRNWIPNHPNMALIENMKDVCPVCLNGSYEECGEFVANTYKYPEYRCSSCGSTWHGSKSKKETKEDE